MSYNIYSIINKAKEDVPVDLKKLCRDLSIELYEKNLDKEVSGQIERINGRYRITVNKNDSEVRRRFTIAHELGHYVLHRDLMGDGIDDSRMYRSENVGKYYNQKIKGHHETEANRFAASLLIPQELITKEFLHLDCSVREKISRLSDKFLVSSQAMEIRLKSIGLIDR